jgi:hypothetical protein
MNQSGVSSVESVDPPIQKMSEIKSKSNEAEEESIIHHPSCFKKKESDHENVYREYYYCW